MKYVHTNIISKDWKTLASFYIQAFNCKLLLPQRDLSGSWLSKGTAVNNAHIKGAHLRLPGYGKTGPTLEILEYSKTEEQSLPLSNQTGLGHLAFEVNNVQEALDKALKLGGKAYGQIGVKEIEGLGTLTFVYLKDPDGNIVAIQNWGREISPTIEENTTTKLPLDEDPVAVVKQEPLSVNPSKTTDETIITNNTEEVVPKTKRAFLDALQNDLDASKQDIFITKEEIKQSKEEAKYQLDKTVQKFQYDPSTEMNVPKTKQELLAELKEEMKLTDQETVIETPKVNATPKKDQQTPPTQKMELPTAPAKLLAEIKTAKGTQLLDLSSRELTMPSIEIAKNLRSFVHLTHPDDTEKSFITWLAHAYRADLVPLIKEYKQELSKQENEKAWALIPRLRDSLHHLLGKCAEEPETLLALKLDRIELLPKDLIATYKNLLTITLAAEKEEATHIRFSYTGQNN